MEKFERELQLEILRKCVDCYPANPKHTDFNNSRVALYAEYNPFNLCANIWYLEEHGLIYIPPKMNRFDSFQSLINVMRATKDGIDFILQDGGLSAMLKVTTVKFHDETMSFLSDFIKSNVKDPEDKKKFLHQLRELPYETTKHMLLELLSRGMTHTPDALKWLETFFHRGS